MCEEHQHQEKQKITLQHRFFAKSVLYKWMLTLVHSTVARVVTRKKKKYKEMSIVYICMCIIVYSV